MSEPVVTISGQRVYPRGQAPQAGEAKAGPNAGNSWERPVAVTKMSPSGWASGGNEEALEAGLPFLGALVAVVLITIAALLIARRHR